MKEDTPISRREFLKTLGAAGAAVLCPEIKQALAQVSPEGTPHYEGGWLYSYKEMQGIYDREYHEEKILKNVVKKKEGKWIGYSKGHEFVIPREFIDKTLSLLRQLMEAKTARFLFRLDASHGHFFVPLPAGEKYEKVHDPEEARFLMQDQLAGVLFHNSEHLRPNPDDPGEVKIFSRRNVIGWYDGRPLTVLPLPEEDQGTAAKIPDQSVGVDLDFKFAAHKDGQFKIVVDGKEIRLDLSFDDLYYY